MLIKILLSAGCLAHIACGMSDCLLGFTPNDSLIALCSLLKGQFCNYDFFG